MPYIQHTWYAGDTVEIHKTYSARYGKKIARGPNRNKTPEAVKKYNAELAERELRLILNTNFTHQDYYITLTYRRELRPDPETARKQIDKFIEGLRKLYKRAGVELKWVAVTEYKNKAIHHHIVINRYQIGKVVDLWQYGHPQIKLLDNTGDYGKLAAYFVKETCKTFGEPDSPSKKRYRHSRNLKKPKHEVKIVKADTWRDDPKPYKGYQIIRDSVYADVNPITGYPYQVYRMVRPPDKRKWDI